MKRLFCGFLIAFATALYFTDKPGTAHHYAGFRLDRRHIGKSCDAWVGPFPKGDMQDLENRIANAKPGETIWIPVGEYEITAVVK